MTVLDDYTAVVDSTGPEAFWPMQETSGSLADVTGNGHTATDAGLGGTITYGQPGPSAACSGLTAVQFEQHTGFTAADDDAWSSAEFGYAGWVWSDPTWAVGSDYRMMMMKTHTSYYEEWFAMLQVEIGGPGHEWANRITDTTGVGWSDVNARPMLEGQWVHVAGTFDGATHVAYWDGLQVASTTTQVGTRVGNSTGPLSIGYHTGVAGRSWIGSLALLAFWTRALTAAEVAALYAAMPVCPAGSRQLGLGRGTRGLS